MATDAEEVWNAARDAQILADHRAGGHDHYDDPDLGCFWPGCSEAWWRFQETQEATSWAL